ncbi:meiotic recombination protein SPO11 [Enteropsectra breve]|nr:meiotic recombination protein SPO11 [Enteropsectra breve]
MDEQLHSDRQSNKQEMKYVRNRHFRTERRDDEIKSRIKNEVIVLLRSLWNEGTLRALKILCIFYWAVDKKRFINKRGIYYENAEIFLNQRNVDAMIKKYTRVLCCEKEELYVRAGLKGMFSGEIAFSGASGISKGLIPEMSEVKEIGFSASRVLVVEKETVFERVQSSGHITVCGKGFPCRNTLRLLEMLAEGADVLCLTDFDPSGLLIYGTYKEAVPKIRRIGLGIEDLYRYGVSREGTIQLSERDKQILNSMEKNPKYYECTDEILFLMGYGRKIELEMIVNRDDFSIESYLECETHYE